MAQRQKREGGRKIGDVEQKEKNGGKRRKGGESKENRERMDEKKR